MVVLLHVLETGLTPRNLVRQTRRCQQEMFEQLGGMWHHDFRPKHFTHEGAKEYAYTPRSGEEAGIGTKAFFKSYTGRKLRKFGHTDPLVWSGESRELSRIRDVRATATAVRIVLSVNKLNFRPAGGRIDMADEMRRISAAEIVQLERRGKQELEGRLRATR